MRTDLALRLRLDRQLASALGCAERGTFRKSFFGRLSSLLIRLALLKFAFLYANCQLATLKIVGQRSRKEGWPPGCRSPRKRSSYCADTDNLILFTLKVLF
jgi:hypothetical protein